MAEGMISGILGDEDEKPEVEAPEALAGAEAFASAVAAKLAGNDPEVAKDTSAFLKKQAQLLETQNEHLKQEHALRLDHLRYQSALMLGQRVGQVVRVSIQLVTALILVGICIGIISMVRDALNSRGVVIEPFDISSNIASEVPNGRIVAAGLLDQITKIQANTRLLREATSDLSAAWSQEASLTIPEVGLSLNQVEYFLRQKLGHDVHISGDVVRASPDRVALTVRSLNMIPKTFSGGAGDLDGLLQQAAEYLYGEANTYAFSRYLNDKKQYRREIDFLQSHINMAPKPDRPRLLTRLAFAMVNDQGRSTYPQQISILEQAIKLAPKLPWSYDGLAIVFEEYGEEERAVPIIQNASNAGIELSALQSVGWNFYDLQLLKSFYEKDIESSNGTGSTEGGKEQFLVAQFNAQQHDAGTAKHFLNSVPIDTQSADDNALYFPAAAFIAAEDGDLMGAIKWWDQSFNSSEISVWVNDVLYVRSCFAAVDYQKAGMTQKADAALDAPKRIMGVDTYVDCYRSRGDVLELRGDWQGAQDWYAKAVKLAPSLPAGYYSWGAALLKHGDLDGAAAQLKLANEKGPHWADPLKVWGDVLVKQGKSLEGLAKYDDALKYAPNWKQLKEARDAVAKQKT